VTTESELAQPKFRESENSCLQTVLCLITYCADLKQELAVQHQKQDTVVDNEPGTDSDLYNNGHLVVEIWDTLLMGSDFPEVTVRILGQLNKNKKEQQQLLLLLLLLITFYIYFIY